MYCFPYIRYTYIRYDIIIIYISVTTDSKPLLAFVTLLQSDSNLAQ